MTDHDQATAISTTDENVAPPSPAAPVVPPQQKERPAIAALVELLRELSKCSLCTPAGSVSDLLQQRMGGSSLLASPALTEAENKKLIVSFRAGGKHYLALPEHADAAIASMAPALSATAKSFEPRAAAAAAAAAAGALGGASPGNAAAAPRTSSFPQFVPVVVGRAPHWSQSPYGPHHQQQRPIPAHNNYDINKDIALAQKDMAITSLQNAVADREKKLAEERNDNAELRRQLANKDIYSDVRARIKEAESTVADYLIGRHKEEKAAAAADFEESARQHAEEIKAVTERAESAEQTVVQQKAQIDSLRQQVRKQQLEMGMQQRSALTTDGQHQDEDDDERDLKIQELTAHVRSLKAALAHQSSSSMGDSTTPVRRQESPQPAAAAEADPAKKRRKKKTTSPEAVVMDAVPAPTAAAARTVAGGAVLATNPEARKRQLGAKLRLWAVDFESRCGRAPGASDVSGDADAAAWTKELERSA